MAAVVLASIKSVSNSAYEQGEALGCSSGIFVFFEDAVCCSLVSLLLPFILVPSCERNYRGRGTLIPSVVLRRARLPATGAHSFTAVAFHSLSSVWKQDLSVSFIMQKNSTHLQMVADVHEAVWTLYIDKFVRHVLPFLE